MTLSVAVPAAAGAAAAGEIGINAALPDIEARIAALLQFNPQPGNFSADIQLAGQIISQLQLAISLGIQPPSLSVQIAIVLAIIADLEAVVLSINANLQIVLAFISLLATGGVYGYGYTGRVDGLGPALTTELASGLPGGNPGDAAQAIVLIATASAAKTAIATMFKVTP
jgi:hypothetical protein